MRTEQVHFTLSPRVLSHLGEDLIKNESIALVELVKNSYDAMASFCRVNFVFCDGMLSELIIDDDGEGMNLDTIYNVWLVIGTNNKRNQLENNQGKRLPLGEKGIGRLGVHKLGNDITLITKRKDYDEVLVKIDWRLLDEVSAVKDFPVSVSTTNETSFPQKHGTRIIIKDLKGNWTRRSLRAVYRDLCSLNSPFGRQSDSFKVIIEANTDIFNGLPQISDILDIAMYRGHCVIENGLITSFHYTFSPWKELKAIDGREIFQIDYSEAHLKRRRENDEGRHHEKPVLEDFSLSPYKIGKVTLDLYIYEKDTSVFGLMGVEKSTLNQYLAENGGVRVYRDGIRVYNYGEKDNDWLALDYNRVKRAGNNLSNNLVIGSVSLSRKESTDLKEKTNREGFIENDAYFTLVDAINYATDLFVRLRNEDKQRLVSIYKKDKRVFEPVISDLGEMTEIINSKVQDTETRIKLLRLITRINTQYKNVRDVLITSANAGLNLGGIIHELEKQVASLVSCVSSGNFSNIEIIAERLEKIISSSSVIIRNSKIEQQSLSLLVENVINVNAFRFQDHAIRIFSNRKQTDIKAMASRSLAIGALTNLLDNSIYWVSVSRTENRMIYFYITEQIEGYSSIIVMDNGSGFKISPQTAIEPFITGKPLNTGMGLGLHIANEVMKEMKGKLLILNKNEVDLPDKAKSLGIDKAIVALCFPKA